MVWKSSRYAKLANLDICVMVVLTTSRSGVHINPRTPDSCRKHATAEARDGNGNKIGSCIHVHREGLAVPRSATFGPGFNNAPVTPALIPSISTFRTSISETRTKQSTEKKDFL